MHRLYIALDRKDLGNLFWNSSIYEAKEKSKDNPT